MPNKILSPIIDAITGPNGIRQTKKQKEKNKETIKTERNIDDLYSPAAAKAIKANALASAERKNAICNPQIIAEANEIKQKSEQLKQSLEVEKIYNKAQKYVNEIKNNRLEPVVDKNGEIIREYKYSNHRRNTYLPNYTVTDYKDGEVTRKYFIVLSPPVNPIDVIDYNGHKFKQFRFVKGELASYGEGKIIGDKKVINKQFRYSASDNSLYTYREGIRKIDDSKSSVEKTFKFDSDGNLEDYIEDSTCYINAYGY